MADCWTLTARWVFPVAAPPLQGGVVTVRGEHLVSVAPAGSARADLDLGNVAVLPGLVNAHTHLDLSGMAGQAPPGAAACLPDWLRQVIAHRRQRTAEQVHADVRSGLAACIRAGTTLLGDISGDGGSREAIAVSGIRGVVFRELIGLSEERAAAARETFIAWQTSHPSLETCRVGISPHAPYSVQRALYLWAARAGVPLTTHLAESRDELELLTERRGAFVPFLHSVGARALEGLAASAAEVIDFCRPARTLLAHGTYLDPAMPLPANVTVVYCPRTHAAFGHAPHPYRAFLARGVRVALGTDSLASNPDLDLLAEARFLRRRDADVAPAVLLRLATLAGAEALGWAEQTGSLEPGKSADLAVVALTGQDRDDPHDLVLAGDGPVTGLLCRGQWLILP